MLAIMDVARQGTDRDRRAGTGEEHRDAETHGQPGFQIRPYPDDPDFRLCSKAL
jgi:hypothetical protein